MMEVPGGTHAATLGAWLDDTMNNIIWLALRVMDRLPRSKLPLLILCMTMHQLEMIIPEDI